MERRKAREDARNSIKQQRASEGDGETGPPIKIAGHGVAANKVSREAIESKRSLKENFVKETSTKRRDEDRNKARERERKDREREGRDTQKEVKKDTRRDSVRDQGSVYSKDKENHSSAADTKPKEIRRGGKSYQEERQRLNERRLAAKGLSQKTFPSADTNDKDDKGADETRRVSISEKKSSSNKDTESPIESKNSHIEGSKSSDQQNIRDSRKYEKVTKTPKDPAQHRNYDASKNLGEGKDIRKNFHNPRTSGNDAKYDDPIRLQLCKEESRKKSYNQEREQRRAAAADRKNQTKKDSAQIVKSDDTPPISENVTKVEPLEPFCKSGGKQRADGSEEDQCSSNGDLNRNDSLLDVKPQSTKEVADFKKRGSSSKADGNDKKDPRTERRIRNKDRPSIEIYRPGMGRFSRQRFEKEKGISKESSLERESASSSPSPVPCTVKTATAPEDTADELVD